jgi:hypothetical protein
VAVTALTSFRKRSADEKTNDGDLVFCLWMLPCPVKFVVSPAIVSLIVMLLSILNMFPTVSGTGFWLREQND